MTKRMAAMLMYTTKEFNYNSIVIGGYDDMQTKNFAHNLTHSQKIIETLLKYECLCQ